MDAQVLEKLERWFHKGEYGRIVFTSDRLLRDSEYAPIRAELLFWKGLAHESAGQAWHGQAMSSYREGIASAGKNRAIKCRLMAAMGNLYSKNGDCASYDRMMKDFARLARDKQPGVLFYGIYVWFNYGVTLDNGFRWQEAAQAYSKAAELAQAFDLPEMLGRCLHNLGGVQLALGQLAQAAATMSQAEGLMDDETGGHKKLSRQAEFFLAAGDLVNAQQAIIASLTHPKVDDMTRADVYYTWARTLEALGRPGEAHEKAMLALDCAVRAVHYPGIHKISEFLQGVKPVA